MKKTIDNIIYVLTAALLITIVVLKDKYFIMVSISAIALSIIGILLLINKNNYAPVVLPMGISLGLSVLLYRFTKIPLYKATLLFFLASLALIMIATIIKYYFTLKYNIATHKKEVAAEIIDLIKNPNVDVDFYYPVLSYKIESEEYEINYPIGYAKNIPEIGDKIIINVNPNDYLDVYFKPDKMSIIKNYISSISVLILVTIVLVGLFKW